MAPLTDLDRLWCDLWRGLPGVPSPAEWGDYPSVWKVFCDPGLWMVQYWWERAASWPGLSY